MRRINTAGTRDPLTADNRETLHWEMIDLTEQLDGNLQRVLWGGRSFYRRLKRRSEW
jgi:hypothetical protein